MPTRRLVVVLALVLAFLTVVPPTLAAASPAGRSGTAAPAAGRAWHNLTRSRWAPLVQESPLVFDQRDHYLVLFTGTDGAVQGTQVNYTYAYYGRTWHNLTSSVAPPPRHQAAMAWDPGLDAILLFGGVTSSDYGLNDTWMFQGGRWTQLHPATSPSPRGGATMVYDAATGQMVLFGGSSDYHCGCGVTGNEWTFARGTWTRQSPSSLPSATLYTTGISYDPRLADMIVFGGWNPSSGLQNTTWVLHNGTWSSEPAPAGLSPRQAVAMGYDPALKETILYGGLTGPTSVSSSSATWAFSASGWTQLPIRGPGPRNFGSIAWDPRLDGMVLFGGLGTNGWYPGTTWLLT